MDVDPPAPAPPSTLRSSSRRKRSSAPDPDPPPPAPTTTKRTRRQPASTSESKGKGKKRAAPEPASDDDNADQQEGPSTKKPRYALRARKATTTASTSTTTMTRKKANSRSKKSAPEHPDDEPSTSTQAPDVEMADEPAALEAQSHQSGDEDDEEHSGSESDEGEDDHDAEQDPDHDHDEDMDDEHDHEHSAALMFGLGGGLGSYMLSLGGKLKTILANIRPAADATTRLVALQELSEILSFGSEEMLSGYFQVDAFVKELVAILAGTQQQPAANADEDDEDAALAAALAASGGGAGFGDDAQLEAQLLACRCLANLMEALPGSAHTVVYHGAVPVLCSKLVEIAYIDLAEQTLSTLEKMSEEYPSAIVREGGLGALLGYLDFFSTQVQRTALQAASNCLRNASVESFGMIKDVFPTIRNVLGYSDARCVEYACLCVIRVVESYHRAAPDNLDALLVPDDGALLRAVCALLLGAAPAVSPGTYTLLLRALGTAARASARVAMAMVDADVGETVYQILTGLPPPPAGEEWEEEQEGRRAMAVMQAVGHRPKEQVEEALGLVCELMPPLPKDGVMDHRAYGEKALAKMAKAKAKAERRSNAAAAAHSSTLAPTATAAASSSTSTPSAPAPVSTNPSAASSSTNLDASAAAQPAPVPAPPPPTRAEMLRARPAVALRFMGLMVPVLVDVFSASVMVNVRSKAVTGVLKALCFLDGEEIVRVLRGVPIASWAGGVLRDRPSLVIGALQIVELLLTKAPDAYRPSFRREGVLHEIERIAARALATPPPAAAEGQRAPLDPADAVTLRARVLRMKGLAGEGDEGDDVLARLKAVVERLRAPEADADAVRDVAAIFTGQSVSSFEFVQSGLVDGLLEFASGGGYDLDVTTRRKLLLDALTPGGKSPSAFGALVRRLQESLTRVEAFEVVTVSQGADDARRNSAQMLARQLRLKLVAEEGSDVPRNCANVVVSIHAIATFQALDDYLRPRVAGLVGGAGGSAARFASMLAALAGRAGPSSRRQPPPPEPEPEPAPAPAPAPAAAESGSSTGVERRRSLRLQKQKEEEKDEDGDLHMDTAEAADEHEHEGEQEQHSAVLVPGGNPDDEDIAEDFVDDDFSAAQDLLNDGAVDTAGVPREPEEKTTNVTVGDDGRDGLSVHAQTPHGTRVATPNPLAAAGSARPSPAAARPSYAAMLSKKPGAGDWHLEFSMDDHPLPLDMTVYGAIHQHEMRKAAAAGTTFQPNTIWQGVYTVKFKKVPGPAVAQVPPEPQDVPMKDRMSTPALASIAEDAPHSKILRLLRVLYKLNAGLADHYFTNRDERPPLADSAFVNNKLTAKLTRQLEEPMIVASSCLPDWALDLSQHFPFLFPFATRYAFLQSTSFGYARLISKWQAQQSRAQDSRREDAFAFLGRVQRQKVRIYRKHVLESAYRVFELYGSSSSVLEVEYFEEVGTGLGPTLEFYAMVSRELARRSLKIWRDADSTVPGTYVHHPLGLFPAPIKVDQVETEGGKRRVQQFHLVGQFIAKALLDSRIIDMSFNKVFMKYILDEEVPLTIGTLELVDPALAKSLAKVEAFAKAKKAIDADYALAPEAKTSASADLRINGVSLDDLALDFTVPGYDIELVDGGRNTTVNVNNVEQYLDLVLDMLLGSGITAAVQAFRDGFSKVFPVTDMQIFSADELVMIFGNADEDWSIETLNEAIKADHGFNVDSRAIRDLISVMSEYDAPTRREFLQFITGSPKLPIGGYRGLNPPFTVVRKPHESPLTPDDYLPSVMTCVNYLKLPEYSSKAVMAAKLRTAMKEGVGSFHLS